MKNGAKARGFTLLEVAITLAAGVVLAITAGLMLYYCQVAWRREQDGVAMQQDARVTMTMIGRMVRNVSTGQVWMAAQELRVTNEFGYGRFFADGTTLRFDPNPQVAGDEVALVSGRLREFAVSQVPSGVRVVLGLQAGDGTCRMVVPGGFTCRNE
jgi:prepilin-type N-terminal cleavage/methylation domain-containing protein